MCCVASLCTLLLVPPHGLGSVTTTFVTREGNKELLKHPSTERVGKFSKKKDRLSMVSVTIVSVPACREQQTFVEGRQVERKGTLDCRLT